MFIIFGTKNLIKRVPSQTSFVCPICQHTEFSIVRVRSFFSLFYIPLIPYRTKYYLECTNCRNVFDLEDGKEKFIEASQVENN